MRTTYRAVAVTGLLAMCATGMSVLGAGSASAAAADLPLDSCTSTVHANAGDHVVVSAKTLLAPQLEALGAIPVVGPLLMGALNPALATLALPPIAVQQLPSGEFAPITGAQIADQLAAALPAIPPTVVQPLRDALTKSCTIPVVKKQILVAPTPAAESPAPAPESPVVAPSVAPPIPAAVASAITSYGRVPRYTYSDLTAVPAAGAGYDVNLAPTLAPKSLTGYGLPTTLGQAPLAAASLPPQLGLLTAPTTPAVPSATPITQSEAMRPVMSEVTALPAAPGAATRVPAEAVLAALLLSLTTAALVRTWVLRRSAG